MDEHVTTTVEQPGSVFALRTREVCRACNGGWMSRLETAAKPLLLGLLGRSGAGAPVSFSKQESTVLAAWSTKTAWTRELTEAGVQSSTQAMREFLRLNGKPPAHTEVWLGRHEGSLRFDARQQVTVLTRGDQPWSSSAERRTAQTTCLTMKGWSLLIHTADGWGVQPPDRDVLRWNVVWPRTGELNVRTAMSLTDRDVLDSVHTRTRWRVPGEVAIRRAGPAQITRRN